MMTNEEYIKDPTVCPFCKAHEALRVTDMFMLASSTQCKEIICTKCGKEFGESWELTGYNQKENDND